MPEDDSRPQEISLAQETIERLAAALADLARQSKPVIPIDLDLWGPKECASFFKCSESQFVQYIKTHHKFPRPISVPLAKPGKNGKAMRMHDRWKASQVIKYADECQIR